MMIIHKNRIITKDLLGQKFDNLSSARLAEVHELNSGKKNTWGILLAFPCSGF